MERQETQTWNGYIASRVRDIRRAQGSTQEELAHRVNLLLGLPWTRATVTAIESGRRDLLAIELIGLLTAFSCDVTTFLGESAPPPNETWLETAPGAQITVHVLRRAFTDRSPSATIDGRDTHLIREVSERIVEQQWASKQLQEAGADPSDEAVLRLARSPGSDAERKAAVKLGMTPEQVATWSVRLWGRSLTEERDSRSDEKSTDERSRRTAKGHVTRKLLVELAEVIERAES